MSIRDIPEILDQQILAGTILVGRLGVAHSVVAAPPCLYAAGGRMAMVSNCIAVLPCMCNSTLMLCSLSVLPRHDTVNDTKGP